VLHLLRHLLLRRLLPQLLLEPLLLPNSESSTNVISLN
jgi:hypothetical protein